jgi:hypothetical protein
MRRYIWLSHPTDGIPGQLAILIGNVVEMVTVEKVEHGWRLTDSAGNTETVTHLPGDEDGPDEAA